MRCNKKDCWSARSGLKPPGVNFSENAFAMTAEGGVDVKVAKHVSVRGQGGYLMTRFSGGLSNTQNNLRLSVGIVIH